jgi:hypothetical protein
MSMLLFTPKYAAKAAKYMERRRAAVTITPVCMVVEKTCFFKARISRFLSHGNQDVEVQSGERVGEQNGQARYGDDSGVCSAS